MTRPILNTACPICRGLGWYEVAILDEIGHRAVITPCPSCNPVEPLPRWLYWLIAAVVVLFVALIAGVFP